MVILNKKELYKNQIIKRTMMTEENHQVQIKQEKGKQAKTWSITKQL